MPTLPHFLWYFQLIFWIVLIMILVILAIRYRKQLWESWLRWIQDLKNFWAKLLGKKNTAAKVAGESNSPAPLKPPKPFSAYVNPFQQGPVQPDNTHRVVKYTFEALKAWAREQGTPHHEDQTPHEFAMELVKIEKRIARQAKKLADFYCTIAFANERVDVKIVNHELAELWKLLGQTQTATMSTLQPV